MVGLKLDLKMVSFSSYDFLHCFKISILCIYKQFEIASYLYIKGYLEILTWMKFSALGHN